MLRAGDTGTMVTVSVIAIAEHEDELDQLRHDLERQTMTAEFVPVADESLSIPEAWNQGIQQATGDILLFTESDVRLPSTWVREMTEAVQAADPGFVMGYEARLNDVHCMSNIGITQDMAAATPFNESYEITEDTEWFARLQNTYEFTISKTRDVPAVFHDKDAPNIKTMYRHGVHRAEIWLDNDYQGKSAPGVTGKRINRILCELATLVGQTLGVLKHPVKLWRKIRR